jgi:molybdopterin synthase sulfur carrier subunit
MAEVWIPPRMQSFTGGQERVQVSGSTVRQLVNNLEREFPGIKTVLYDEEEDNIMPGVAVIIDGETSQLGILEKVNEDSEVHFLPALGGGALS